MSILNKLPKACTRCGRAVIMAEVSPGRWRCMEEAYMRKDPESLVTAIGSVTGAVISGEFVEKSGQGIANVLRPHNCG